MLTARNGCVFLKIKTSTGRPFVIRASKNDTVLSVKERITTKTGLFPQQQRLIYKGLILTDELTIGFYGISQNQTLYLAANKNKQQIHQKPEEKLKRLLSLTQQLEIATASKFNEILTEMKELVEDPILKGYSRLDQRAADAIQAAVETMDTIERPQSRQTEQYLAKTTDYALSLVESAPDGLRMLQSIIDDYSSDDDSSYSNKPTRVEYRPRIMTKPLPPLKGSKSIFQSSAIRTFQTRKEVIHTPRETTKLYSLTDVPEFDELHEIPFGSDYDQTLSQKFASQVEILKKMGFDDERNILQALGETNGNVQKAAKLLQNKFFYHV